MYNGSMRLAWTHPWPTSIQEARDLQERLASQVTRRNEAPDEPRYVAGIDVSGKGRGRARPRCGGGPPMGGHGRGGGADRRHGAALPLRARPAGLPRGAGGPGRPGAPGHDARSHPGGRPGAGPSAALRPGLPRRPARRSAHHRVRQVPPGGAVLGTVARAGASADLVHRDEVVGSAVRTRGGVSPVFVSVGHRVDLPAAVRLTLACCRGYRVPEPTRTAHHAAAGRLPETERVAAHV